MRGLRRTPGALRPRGVRTAILLLGLLLELSLPGIHGAAIGTVSHPDASAVHTVACRDAAQEAEVHGVTNPATHDAERCPQCQSFAHARAATPGAAPAWSVPSGDVPVHARGLSLHVARVYVPAAPRAPPARLLS